MVGVSRFWAGIVADDGFTNRYAENLAWEWPRTIWYWSPGMVALSIGALVAARTVAGHRKQLRRLVLTISMLAMLVAGSALLWAGVTVIRATIPTSETEQIASIHNIELPAGGTRGATCCMYSTTYFFPQNPQVMADEISKIDGYHVDDKGQKYIGAVRVTITGDLFGSRLSLGYS